MLNLHICTVIIMTKKSCDSLDSNPGYMYMGSKSTKTHVSTTLYRSMQCTDKNNQYILKL